MTDNKTHWENIYSSRPADQMSWTQAKPKTSLKIIKSYRLAKTASIIDIGGGDSLLADYLLEEGYTNISVLDISEQALMKAKLRLGEKSNQVNWIVSDIQDFKPQTKYDIWHDRAAFHFLTTPEQISRYIATAKKAVSKFMSIGTFSETGPDKCSGLFIKKYSEALLEKTLLSAFNKIKCISEDHFTPFNTIQNFLFCSFKKNDSPLA
jgi:cyclopropane fatty-acyl-phospholipid synthase-like methyltransferase